MLLFVSNTAADAPADALCKDMFPKKVYDMFPKKV